MGETIQAVHFPTPELGWFVTDRALYKIVDGSVERFANAPMDYGFSTNVFGSTTSAIVTQGEQLLLAAPGILGLSPIPNSDGSMYMSVAGRSLEDVWFGRSDGTLRHYDGFSFVDIESGLTEGILQLVAAGADLFFATEKQIGRLNAAGDVELLSDWSSHGGVSVTNLAFNGSTLFVSVNDTRFIPYECGATFVLWFDGVNFRRF
ncbi:MAG: hypothetical protein GXP55_18425 [Deltaproteobacteria bacterium]|nr:hypothetical protein [Deltaproteobacteria bacterium]